MKGIMARQARAIKTYEDIILAAAKVVNDKNYEKATIKQIAETGGFTQGAVYFHFESKEQIAHAIVSEQNRISQEKAQRVIDLEIPAVEKMLQTSADLTFDIVSNPLVQAGMRLFTEVQVFETPPLMPWKEWDATTVFLLRAGITEGDINADLDLQAAPEFISSSYAGTYLRSGLTTKHADLAARILRMWKMIIASIVRPERQELWRERANSIFVK